MAKKSSGKTGNPHSGAPPIKRTGTSNGGRTGDPGTSNVTGVRRKSSKAAKKA